MKDGGLSVPTATHEQQSLESHLTSEDCLSIGKMKMATGGSLTPGQRVFSWTELRHYRVRAWLPEVVLISLDRAAPSGRTVLRLRPCREPLQCHVNPDCLGSPCRPRLADVGWVFVLPSPQGQGGH